MSKVYILECNGLYKIGITNNTSKRIKQLQTGNGFKIKEVVSYEFFSMAYCIESDLHKMFSRSCVLGEWFDLTEYELDRLKLQLKFEKDKLNIVGCDTKQRIYSELYVKAYSSSQGIEEILVEMANHKFKVET